MFRRSFRLRCRASIVAATTALSEPAKNQFSIAVQIKQHCSLALVKYSQVPAEVFVHRAVSYIALEQPYFALADFRNAAERGVSDPKYERLVTEAIAKMPDEEEGVFESSDAHVKLLVQPSLGNNVALQCAPGKGRGLFATAPIAAGSVVLKRTPAWLTYPLKEGLCSFCGGAFSARTFACKNDSCHEEYCSRECRTSAHHCYHGGVCHNQRFQTIELELYSKMRHSSDVGDINDARAAALHLLMLRVYGASLTTKVLPSVLPQIRTLSGKLTYSPAVLASTTLDTYRKLSVATNTVASISFEEFVCVMAKLSNNIFHEHDLIYAHIPRSMLNHSCEPNCLDTGGELVAVKDLPTGDEICSSYYPQLNELPFELRKRELLRRGMVCRCVKCLRQQS